MLTLSGIVVAVIVTVLILAATRPNSFRVERSTSIQASPDRVFDLVDDFHQWGKWSPWEPLDPELRRTYSGAERGTGAVYEWEGNNKVGKGRMEIMQDARPSLVKIKLDFLKPFEAHNTAEFSMQPNADRTNITWAMYGRSPYMMKVMGIFVSMDKMVGKDFEKGLANMKAVAEQQS
jgi:hypothetical protein